MRLARGAIAALAMASTTATASTSPVEQAVQFALERLQSRVPFVSTHADGSRIEVRVLRTWKSVSGHYCRHYEARVGQRLVDRAVRCRDGDAIWKLPTEDQ